MHKEWVHRIRIQCEEAGVPFFFNQWGGVWKKTIGRDLDGRTYNDYPEVEEWEPPHRHLRPQLVEEYDRQ